MLEEEEFQEASECVFQSSAIRGTEVLEKNFTALIFFATIVITQ